MRRVPAYGMSLVAAWLRRALWRGALIMVGGFTVRGRLPRGGCVVVANHSSHADTAAMLAALDARHRPRVAAAADYWFRGGLKAWICRGLAAGFAVRRGGGGSADLAQAAALLRAGRAVVVFPEGTRSRTCDLATFRSGAARLAATASVPLVPVGIVGTRDLLPVHGSFRPAPISVRIGTPVAAGDINEATADCEVQVRTLVADPPERPDSRIRNAVATRMAGIGGVVAVAGWSFAEAISWPIVPEIALLCVLLAAPGLWWKLIPTAVLANLAGGLAMLTMTDHGVVPPAPLTTPQMRQVVAGQVAVEGARAVRHQPLAGIPFKVYAAQSGEAGVDPLEFTTAAVRARGLRISAIGILLAAAGWLLGRRRQLYSRVLFAGLLCFTAGLARVVAGWS